MAAYLKERQTIVNPFSKSFPNRPNPSPFAELPEAAPKKEL